MRNRFDARRGCWVMEDGLDWEFGKAAQTRKGTCQSMLAKSRWSCYSAAAQGAERLAWLFFGPADGGGRPIMLYSGRMFWMLAGALVGVLGALLYFGQAKPALAANDRFEDYIMCTGPVAVTPKSTTDGVWILDYRSGKLLGTVIDRSQGKILGFAEVDLTTEFGIPPRQNVHFLMTTGN